MCFHLLWKSHNLSKYTFRFSFKTLLKKHKSEIHDKKGNIKCTLCQEKFITKQDRQKHVRKFHSSTKSLVKIQKPIQCELCLIIFKQEKSLNSHVVSHTIELRNNMWPECGHKCGLWDDFLFWKETYADNLKKNVHN